MLFWKGRRYGGVSIVLRGAVSKSSLELRVMNDRIIYVRLKTSYGCMSVIECCTPTNEDRDEEKIV